MFDAYIRSLPQTNTNWAVDVILRVRLSFEISNEPEHLLRRYHGGPPNGLHPLRAAPPRAMKHGPKSWLRKENLHSNTVDGRNPFRTTEETLGPGGMMILL